MGAQKHKPRDVVKDVLGVENATSRQRAHCGGDFRPFSGGGLSTICFEVEESSAAVMSDWSWEPANASSSQQASPLQSSPLQSSSSQSSHEAMQRTSQESMQPPLDAPGIRTNSSRTSLVETLQTCLTSLPPGSSNTSPRGRSLSDPSGAASPALRQSRSSGALSGSTSKPSLGPAKSTSKRRSRASRRVPTTVLEATCGDFRDMVQRLTGIPAATPPSSAPVRPQPQRATSTYIRPDRALPSASVIRPASVLNFTTPTTHPSFDDLRHPLHRSSWEIQSAPLRSSNVARGLKAGASVSTPSSMSGSIMTTRTLSAPTHWWDSEPSTSQIDLPNVNSSSIASEIIDTSGPPRLSTSSAELIMLQEDINEFSMSQFDAWLSGDDH